MPTDSTPTFDLTTEPWLPVQRLDGTEIELSLLDVLLQADVLRRIVGDVPTQEFALMRFLLAVLHDAIDGPQQIDDWEELWEGGIPAERITAYLTEHRDRFDLLHPQAPFFQVAGLHTKNHDIGSLDRLVADVPNGAPYFTMRARGVDRLSFAEAARWLIHAHAYDISGIKSAAVGDPRTKGGKGYPQGIGWAGQLGGVLAEGETLHETLLLNLIAFDTSNLQVRPKEDLPAWRRPQLGPAAQDRRSLAGRPAGPRDLYTWQARRVRLFHDGDGVHGVLLCYGDPLQPQNRHRVEPMTAWRRSKAQEKKLGLPQVYMPKEHDPGRSAWRGLDALVASRGTGRDQRQEAAPFLRPRILDWVARLTVEGPLDEDFFIRARLYGMVYGTQQSLTDEIVHDAVAMSVVLLRQADTGLGAAAVGAVHDAEAAVIVLADLAADLARATGAITEPPAQQARTLGFAALDGPFRDWLAELRSSHDPRERRESWQQTAHRILSRLGDDLLEAAGPAAWEGRVVTTKGSDRWLNTGQADLWFRRRLREKLPGPVDESSDGNTQTEQSTTQEALS